MKKIISLCLCAVLVFCAASAGLNGRAAPKLKEKRLVFSDDGYSFIILDESGNETQLQKPAKSAAKAPARRTASAYPSSYSSVALNRLPAVKNQGQTGTCWAFAAVTALESDAITNGLAQRGTFAFSPSHLTWFTYTLPSLTGDPHYGEGMTSNSPYMRGGNWVYAASTLMEWSGIANNSDYPFYTYQSSLLGNYPESARYDTGSGFLIDDAVWFEVDDFESIKGWITEHGACTAAIYYDDQYENQSTNSYYEDLYDSDDPEVGINHNITLVGWDDNYPASNFTIDPGSDGAWLVQDSWGTNVHNRGFYWLSYQNAHFEYPVGFSVREKGKYYGNYSYNGACPQNATGCEGPFTVANVFTARGYEKISSVSFFSFDLGDTAVIKVYKNLSSGSNPTSGTLACTMNVNLDNAGYYTFDLPSEISVNPGTKFSVCVTLDNADSDVYFAVETGGSDTLIYSHNSGESFYYLNNVWTDNDSEGYGNFFIQAFTKCSHNFEQITVAPTCTEDGSITDVCTQCGDVYSVNAIPATGHTFGSWSDYTLDGARYVSYRYCSVCGAEDERHYDRGTNTVTLERLLEIIFERIFAALGLTFSKL